MKNLLTLIAFYVLLVCSTNASIRQALKATFLDVSTAEADNLIQSNTQNADFVILDVRAKTEYDEFHIKNSFVLDFYAATFDADLNQLNKNKTYLVYCRSGNRSGQTITKMQTMGFTSAYNMLGGMTQWNLENRPVASPTSLVGEDISTAESNAMIAQHVQDGNFVLLDVRTPAEYQAEYINGSINLDFYATTFDADLALLDKNKQYLVYCRSGNRSRQAVDKMLALNFIESYNMLGGIEQWVLDGYPTMTAQPSYCQSGGNSVQYEWIAGVKVGNFENLSAADNGYIDNTGQLISVDAGTTQSVTLTPGFASSSYTEYWKIFIDFNGNGDCTDAGDEVFSGNGTSVVSGTLNIPSGESGYKRLRVIMRYNAAPLPCGTFDYGETEDYTIFISGATDTQPPTAPTGLYASNVTSTTIQLVWNASSDNVGVTAYDVYAHGTIATTVTGTSATLIGLDLTTTNSFYVTAKDAAGNVSSPSNMISITCCSPDTISPTAPTNLVISAPGTSVSLSWDLSTDNIGVVGYNIYRNSTLVGTTSSTSYTLTGLIPNISYSIYVTAIDAAGNESPPGNIVNIYIPDPGNCITAFPFTESFENGLGEFIQETSDDIDWTERSGSTPSSNTGPSGASEGSNYMYIEASNPNYPGKTANLVSSCFDFSGASDATLDFMYHMYGSSMGILNVQASTDGITWSTLWTLSGDQGNSWQAANVSLASYAGQANVQFRFNGITGSSYTSDICIDMFIVQVGGGSDTQSPTAPTELNSTGTTSSSISLSWNASSDNVGVTAYDIYMNDILTGSTSSTTYIVTGLSYNTNYLFSVKAKDAAGNESVASNSILVSTCCSPDTEPPTAPTNLNAFNISPTFVDLNWNASTDNVGVVEYDVFNNSVPVSTTTSTSFTLTGLSPNTSYSFYVIAKDAAGNESPPSNTVSIITPDVPGGCITLFPFSESFENGLGEFTQSTGDDTDWTQRSGSTPSSSTGSSSASDGSYYMYIEASSPNYPGKIANLLSPCFDFSGESDATLDFMYHMYGSAMGTLNVQANTNGTTWITIWTLSGDQGNSWQAATVSLASYAGQSNVQIRFNGTTGSSYTSDICIDKLIVQIGTTPTDTQPPTAPSNLTVSNVTANSVNLNWNASSDNVGVTGYDVFRGSTFVETTSSTSYNVTGLSSGTTYSFHVVAKDAADNESVASNIVNIITSPGIDTQPPTSPTGLTAMNVTDSSTYLNWNPSTDNIGVTGYDIYGNSVLLASTISPPYTLTGLTPNTAYTLYLKAKDAAGNESVASNSVYITTTDGSVDTQPPTAPTYLIAANVSTNSVQLTWQPSTDNVMVKDYDVYRNGLLIATTTSPSYNATGLTPGTNYQFYVKAKDTSGNVSPQSNAASVQTIAIPYCASSGNSQQYEWIAGVQFGGFTKTSGASPYTDFTDSLTIRVDPGFYSPIVLTPGFSGNSYNEYWIIWVDYNNDGDFDDSGEQFYTNNSSSVINDSVMFVPAGTVGIFRVRVTMSYENNNPGCGTFSYGETEDYKIWCGCNPMGPSQKQEEIPGLEFSYYPNPADTYFNLLINSSTSNDVNLKLYNSSGKMVYTEKIKLEGGESLTQVNVGDIPKGFYILSITDGKEIKSEKLLIK